MTSKCANPECPQPFLYFRAGKIFTIEVDEERDEHGATVSADPWSQKHKTEFFWLCGDCCRYLTLRVRRSDGNLKVVFEAVRSVSAQYSTQNDKEELYEAA